MSTDVPSAPWARFTADPRRPDTAALRASDRDRDVVHEVLAASYADGRLTREEHDQRTEAAASARTMGELPALIGDLVPERGVVAPDDLHRRAVSRWEAQRREALRNTLLPTVICWLIWVVTGLHEGGGFSAPFPWPLFVMLGTGAHLARVLMSRQDIIAEEQRRLERRQRKLERPHEQDPGRLE